MAVELWLRFVSGGVIAVGTLVRSLYGYYTAKTDNNKITFNWQTFFTEFGPAVVTSFLTGYFIDTFDPQNLILGLFAGVGLGSAISKMRQ